MLQRLGVAFGLGFLPAVVAVIPVHWASPFAAPVAARMAPQSAGSGAAKPKAPLDEASFVKALAALQKLGDAGKWSEEKKGLQKLLTETGDQPFVTSRRTELVDEVRRAAIRAAVPQPDPATLTDGKLLAWDRHTGALSLSYGPDQWKDFSEEGGMAFHPAFFDGPVTLKLDGEVFRWHGEEPLRIFLGVRDDQGMIVTLSARKDEGNGAYYPALTAFEQFEGKSRTPLGEFPRAPNYGNAFAVEISVGTTEIAVSAGGARLGAVKLPKAFRGRIGLSTRRGFKHVALRGAATVAWLQGKLDAVTHDAEQKFLATFKLDDELPPWLRAPAAAAAAEPSGIKLPWELTEAQATTLSALLAKIATEPPPALLAELRALASDELPVEAKDWVYYELLASRGALALAGERFEAFCRKHPDFSAARYLHARLQMERMDYDEAARELAALHGQCDDPAAVATDLVEVDLLRGEPEAAQKELRAARAEGVASPEFDEQDELVVHLLRGPNFQKRFEQKSPHFVVATDIDADAARAALKVLEESYAICTAIFGEAAGPPKTFPVFLFSGRTGYVEYAGRASKMAHSTAGMYSRLFKHLLVWNQPERQETTGTLRHEATHQYLDLLGYRVPTWFNEGLACYVERIASSSKADLKGGALDRLYLDRLATESQQVIPLEDFVALPPSRFYDAAQIAYPEAWALVHFLRHGEAAAAGEVAPTELGRRMMAALAERVAPSVAVKRTFEGVDWKQLDQRFAEYVARRRRELAAR